MELCTLGHIARTHQLSALGYTRARLARAVADGSVRRLRRGTYACVHLDGPLLVAARMGGAITCVSALREHDVWAGHDRRVHVQLSPHASTTVPPGVRVHRELARFGGSALRVSSLQALWQAMHCLDGENAIAAMESAIHKGFLTEEQVRRLGVLAPRRLQGGIRQLSTTSESGNETIVRLRLVAVGYRVEPHGHVPGLGHQDLLVEDCVGLEVDSEAWHGQDQAQEDVRRDLVSEGLGRRVLRIRPDDIHQRWPSTLAVIDRMVRDALALRH